MASVHVRITSDHTARLDALRAAQPMPPSRNALASHLLALVLAGDREGLNRFLPMPPTIEAILGAGFGVRTMTREEAGLPPAAALKGVRVPDPETDGAPLDERGAQRRQGERLRFFRGERRQVDCAAEAGVSVDQWRRAEKGARVDEDAAERLRGWMREREGGAG